MKVLHINTYSQGGGAETVAYSLFTAGRPNTTLLVKEDIRHEPGILEFPRDRRDYFFRFLDKVAWKFGVRKSLRKLLSIEDSTNHTWNKLRKLAAYREADIIHLHNIHGGYFDLEALADIGREKKIVWTLHDMWAMTGGEAHVFEDAGYRSGIGRTPYKHIPPVSSPWIDRRQHFIDLKKQLYAGISDNLTFVPVSRWLNDCLHAAYVWNPGNRSRMIYNGYDPNVFHSKAVRSHTIPRILVFNSPNPFKGEDILQEVLRNLSHPFDLIVIGDPLKPATFNAVHYPYLKDRGQLASIFHEADILLFPSRAESFGLVPLEAMACGVCVYASNIGGLPELIRHGETGYLFASGDELLDLLGKGLQQVDRVRAIGEQAREAVSQQFTLDQTLNNYQALYREICS